MSMFDNLKKAVADTITSDIIMVDVDDLHESADNFFEVERIEEFAETILAQGGVKENLIVMPRDSGGYELISGHRRTAAVRHLLKKGETVSRFLPCLVANYSDEEDKKLDIVLMNITARIISDADLWKSYEIVNEVLQKKKALGEKFGKVQNKLAELLGVSVGQVSKIQKIDNSAIPEVKEAVKSGDISINTANEISKLDIEKQNEIVSGKPLKDVKPKDVKPDDKKGNINVTFSEKHEAFPLFSTDVVEAFESMNLYRIVADDKKQAILEILMNTLIRNHKESRRRKNV